MDRLTADSLPWLEVPQQRLRAAQEAGRLPHSLLLLSIPGLGAEHLAAWIAALALCDSPAGRPCAHCPSCQLLLAGSHPDLHVVRLESQAQQIKIEQVRDLIEALSLTSYRGARKAAIIEGAEALNTHSANAFLKTLEEPTSETVLIMIAKPSHRLPATIASRCLRLNLRPPTTDVAQAWLRAHAPATQSWDAALALTGGAPLAALELDAGLLTELDRDMHQSVADLIAGSVDLTLLAERWVKSNPDLRITWLENWITRRVHAGLAAAPSHQTAERVGLSGALLKPKIRALFELLDAARDLRRLASTGLNQQLALEALLVGGRTALAK
jgi:DNA polymerase-3 subunit delta'